MTKGELIWVVIRGVGLFLVLRALFLLPEIINTGAWLAYLGDSASSEVAKLIAVQRQQLGISVILCAAYFIVGLYFLRWGNWVFRLLNFVRPERSNSAFESGPPSAAAQRER